MDGELDIGAEPRCGACGTVMYTVDGGYRCRGCGYEIDIPWMERPVVATISRSSAAARMSSRQRPLSAHAIRTLALIDEWGVNSYAPDNAFGSDLPLVAILDDHDRTPLPVRSVRARLARDLAAEANDSEFFELEIADAPMELRLDEVPLTIDPRPRRKVRGWFRFGNIPVRLDAIAARWTPDAVGITFTVGDREHRCWVWSGAVDET